MAKMKFLGQSVQKLMHLQTDRQTDRKTERQTYSTKRITTAAFAGDMLITMTHVNSELENVASAATLPLEVARRSSRYRMLVQNILIWCGTLCWFCRPYRIHGWGVMFSCV